jgi:hypothetical protein
VLKVYADESGTHSGTLVFTVAGFISEGAQWEELKQEWATLMHEHSVPGGVFHTAECLSEERVRLAPEIVPLIQRRVITGHVVSLLWPAFVETFGDILPTHNMRLRVAFHMCSQRCLSALAEKVGRAPGQYIAAVFDWNEQVDFSTVIFRKWMSTLGVDYPYPSITFASKEMENPLQAADVLAWSSYQRATDRLALESGTLPLNLWTPFGGLFDQQLNIKESWTDRAEMAHIRETLIEAGQRLLEFEEDLRRLDKVVQRQAQKEWPGRGTKK